MPLDPEFERLLRKRHASQRLTTESLQELDALAEERLELQEKIERTKKRVRLVVGFLASVLLGWLFNKLPLATA